MYREPTAGELAVIEKKMRRADTLKKLDALNEGESMFIEDTSLSYIQSLCNSMRKKGKRFSQTKQVIGYTLTRYSL